MQISDTEVRKVLSRPSVVAEIAEIGAARLRVEDEQIVQDVEREVKALGDREDRVAELSAKIKAGTYRPSSESIVESMVRRSIADQAK